MSKIGRFGEFGGQYIPETVMTAVHELEKAYDKYKDDPEFNKELQELYHNYAGRPSMLYYAEKMTKDLGGAKIYIKREDLNHTGSHKINNVLGQILLAKKMGKKRMKKWPIVWKHVYTKLVIILGFGIFYFEDLGQLGQFFLNITGISMIANGAPFTDPMTFSSLRNNIFLILFAILVSLPVLPKIKSYFLESKNDTVYAIGRVGSVAVCMVLLAVVSVLLVDTTNNVFLYFRF